MKVLTLNYEFPPVGGGGGRVSLDVARGLVARGHQVEVLTSAAPGLPARDCLDGVAVRRLRCLRRRPEHCSVPEMGAFVAAAVPAALRLVRRSRPDAVHVHFAVPTGPVAYALRRLLGLPYLLTAHLGDVPGGVPGQTDTLFKLLNPAIVPVWRTAARVTAVSGFVAELAETAYKRPVEVLHNGLELPDCEGEDTLHDPIRFIFVGRFNPQKNLPFLFEVLPALTQDWALTMVGDGPDRAACEAAVAARGLTGKVEFLGWQDDCAVDDLLSTADVLLMPSLSEGFPVAAVRALGHGLAICGSDIGGLADVVVDGDNGRRLPLNNTKAWQAGLAGLLADPDAIRAMKRRSRVLARSFDISAIVDRYEELLLETARCG